MTQKLPFKEPGRAHKRRNNTGRLTFHFVLFALLGVMLLSLGAYGRVKLHGIYDQQLLSRRSDSHVPMPRIAHSQTSTMNSTSP